MTEQKNDLFGAIAPAPKKRGRKPASSTEVKKKPAARKKLSLKSAKDTPETDLHEFGPKITEKTVTLAMRAGFRISSHIPEEFPTLNKNGNPLTRPEKIALLKKYFPLLRPDCILRAPFAKNFHEEILARAPKGTSKKAVVLALKQRTARPLYQALVASYVQRRHLDGSPAETISEHEAERARHIMSGSELFIERIGVKPHEFERIVYWADQRERGLPCTLPSTLVRERTEVKAEQKKYYEEGQELKKQALLESQRINQAYGGKEKRKAKQKKERKKNAERLVHLEENARQNEAAIKEAYKNGLPVPEVYTKHIVLRCKMEAEEEKRLLLNAQVRMRLSLPQKKQRQTILKPRHEDHFRRSPSKTDPGQT